MRILLVLLIVAAYNLHAQKFEGYLRYGITYESTGDEISKYKLKKKDSVLVAFKKGGGFLKYINSPNDINIYKEDTKLVYLLSRGENELVTFNPVIKLSSENNKVIVNRNDSIKKINNINCKKVVFDFGYYRSIIYYSDDSRYYDLGKLFYYVSFIDVFVKNSFIKNYLVVRYTQELNNVKTIIDLLEFKEEVIDDSIFSIPRFKKSRKYDYDKGDRYSVYKIIEKGYKFPNLK